MTHDAKKILVGVVSVCAAILMLAAPGRAQLVLVDERYKVTKVDTIHRRLEATNPEGTTGITYILIDGNTKVWHKGNRVAWTSIRVGKVIRVRGGITWDMKVKAKDISW